MSSYNYSEIVKMQDDALKRVEQMKKNANAVVTQAKSRLSESPESPIIAEKEKSFETKKSIEKGKSAEKVRHVPMPDDYIRDLKAYAEKATLSPLVPSSTSKKSKTLSQSAISSLVDSCGSLPQTLKNVFSDFNIDSDKAFLLSLILLLAEEKSDEFLIISLLYMMI
ncbi:MAG TPA: hypothetical protein VFC76_04115 [Oscillospiraceae bacterium]|nr:hypothetical protein [Oscillospiraceae bacterium]